MTETNFPFPSEGKRYYTWNRYLRDQFGHKVFKVALDAGFDCPNRDGTVAFGGCTFCSAAHQAILHLSPVSKESFDSLSINVLLPA